MAFSTSGGLVAEIDGTTNAADTWIVLDTLATGKVCTVVLRAVNRNTTTAKVRVAIEINGSSGTPDDAEHLIYDQEVAASGFFDTYPHQLAAGDSILVRSDTVDVNFRADVVVDAA